MEGKELKKKIFTRSKITGGEQQTRDVNKFGGQVACRWRSENWHHRTAIYFIDRTANVLLDPADPRRGSAVRVSRSWSGSEYEPTGQQST